MDPLSYYIAEGIAVFFAWPAPGTPRGVSAVHGIAPYTGPERLIKQFAVSDGLPGVILVDGIPYDVKKMDFYVEYATFTNNEEEAKLALELWKQNLKNVAGDFQKITKELELV